MVRTMHETLKQASNRPRACIGIQNACAIYHQSKGNLVTVRLLITREVEMGKNEDEQFSPLTRAIVLFVACLLVALAIIWVGQ